MLRRLFGRIRQHDLFATAGDATPEERDTVLRRSLEFQKALEEHARSRKKSDVARGRFVPVGESRFKVCCAACGSTSILSWGKSGRAGAAGALWRAGWTTEGRTVSAKWFCSACSEQTAIAKGWR